MDSDGETKVFLQALIQVAAACVHLTRGNAAPAIRLLALAAGKLDRFGDVYAEIDTDFLRKEIGLAAERVGRGDPPGDVVRTIRL
jgi:predicted metal-dependent hydrolase